MVSGRGREREIEEGWVFRRLTHSMIRVWVMRCGERERLIASDENESSKRTMRSEKLRAIDMIYLLDYGS